MSRELNHQAIMVTGCYTLHLYCRYKHPHGGQFEFPHVYTAEKGSTCRRRATKAGWILHRDGYASCPQCATTPDAGEGL